MIIDTNQDVTAKLPALKAAGVVAIGRYLNRLNPQAPKVIKPAEAKAFAAIGMPLFLIYEIGGRPSGAAQGQADRNWCKAYLPTIGMPSDCAIFNTVDFDAAPADMPGVVAYFQAFRAPGSYRTGGYGSGFVTGQLLAHQAVDRLRWLACSRGFRGTKEALAAGAYELAQSLSPALDGVDVDVNTSREGVSDFGARVPFAGDNQQMPALPAAAAQAPEPSFLDRIKSLF